jgi:hypothetical protein
MQMNKGVPRNQKLLNLVNSLADYLSTTADVVEVLEKCANLLDFVVQDDGSVNRPTLGRGKKRRRIISEQGSDEELQRPPPPHVGSPRESRDEHSVNAPLLVQDNRRGKQVSRRTC